MLRQTRTHFRRFALIVGNTAMSPTSLFRTHVRWNHKVLSSSNANNEGEVLSAEKSNRTHCFNLSSLSENHGQSEIDEEEFHYKLWWLYSDQASLALNNQAVLHRG